MIILSGAPGSKDINNFGPYMFIAIILQLQLEGNNCHNVGLGPHHSHHNTQLVIYIANSRTFVLFYCLLWNIVKQSLCFSLCA